MQETKVPQFKDDNPFASLFSEMESKARSVRSTDQPTAPAPGPTFLQGHIGAQDPIGTPQRGKGRRFSLLTRLAPQHRLRPLLRTSILLLLCVVSIFALHRASRAWLISRLSDNLSAHPRHTQLERLEMLSEFGAEALPAILQTLTQDDAELGMAGYRTVTEMQARWQTAGGNDALSSENVMMDEIASLASKCPPDRRQWLATLLKQTLLATVDHSDDASQECYQRATQLYQTLSPLTNEGNSLQSPRIARQILAARQALDDQTDGDGTGQDGPARALVPLPTRVNAAETPDARAPGEFNSVTSDAPSEREPQSIEDFQGLSGIVATPITLKVVPRSPGSPTQATPSNSFSRDQFDNQALERESAETFRGSVGTDSISNTLADSNTVAEAPLAVYDTRSVIGLLNSEDLSLRNHAINELRRRNMSDSELNLAFQIVSQDIEVRRNVVASLGQRSDIDPRPWLLWLAEDPAREIRLEAISRLGTLNDPNVESSLRSLLSNERDTVVASRIRKILGLR